MSVDLTTEELWEIREALLDRLDGELVGHRKDATEAALKKISEAIVAAG